MMKVTNLAPKRIRHARIMLWKGLIFKTEQERIDTQR